MALMGKDIAMTGLSIKTLESPAVGALAPLSPIRGDGQFVDSPQPGYRDRPDSTG